MICPYCKSELPDESQFCSGCGQAISSVGDQSSTSSSYWNAVEKEAARDEKIRTDAEDELLQKQKKKNRTVIASLIVLGVVAVIIFYFVSIYPSQQYKAATELLNSGEYHEAMVIFEDLGNYKDSGEQIIKCREGICEQRYQDGMAQYQNGNYNEALSIFEELGSYKESQSYAHECRLQIWEIESNNTYQTATSISLNKEYFGVLESEWETEQDWYSFALETPGCVSLIFNSEQQSSDDAYWDVSIRSSSNPEEDLWQEYIDGDTTKTESFTLSLSAGTYYVEIESSTNHSTDTYSFKVVYEENKGNWEIESNNTYQTATSIFLNKEYFGLLQSEWETEQDWYSFTLETPGRVSLIFNSEKQSGDNNYWDISIRSKDNPEKDLWQEYVRGYTTKTESFTLSLSVGTYYVEIESSDSHSTDTYSFKVIHEENEGNWEIESNNTHQTATSISLNKVYFGLLQSEWETEQDWYVFTLETPGCVSLIFNSEKQSGDNNYWDISIRSKDNPEKDLWQEYVRGYTTKTESDALSLSAGTYYVEIESSNSHSTDSYSFEVIIHD